MANIEVDVSSAESDIDIDIEKMKYDWSEKMNWMKIKTIILQSKVRQ